MKTKSNQSPILDTSSITLASLMGLTLLSGLILSSSFASADTDATDVVTITVPTSCSMSSTGTNSHTAEIGNGQSNSTIGETTITTYCNDNEGFAIYAIGYTGDTLGNNKLTSTSLGSTHDIVTGTATSGNTSNWAMKLSTISSPAPNFPIIISGTTSDTLKEQGDPDYSTFQEVPDDYTKVAYRTSATDTGTNAEGSVLKTTYQVYISPTQSAGTYTGQVKYVMVHPYMQDDSNKPTTAFIMQNVSQWGSSVTAGQEVTAIDSRDGKSYTVARLADGNLWMTQNLDFDIGTTTLTHNTTTLKPDDTDIPADWTPIASTRQTNDIEWDAYHEETNPDGGDQFHAESYDPGNLYWNGNTIEVSSQEACIETNGTWEIDGNGYSYCINYSNTGDSHYHLGNYYNWTAAVAMNDSSELDEGGTLVEQSICPAGWTLPRVGSGDDTFDALLSAYNFSGNCFADTNTNNTWDLGESALWTSPFYFVASGWHNDGCNSKGLCDLGLSGGFWSSVVYADYAANGLFYGIDGNYAATIYDGSREASSAVRCIARPVSNSVSGF